MSPNSHFILWIKNTLSTFTLILICFQPPKVPSSDVVLPRSPDYSGTKFLQHVITQSDVLSNLGSQTFTPLRAGQLILHTLSRPVTATQSMQLSSLARLTHERVFNTQKYPNQELYIPAGLVLGLTCSIASRDLHEVNNSLGQSLKSILMSYRNELLWSLSISLIQLSIRFYLKSLIDALSQMSCIQMRRLAL
jgi:hypothetical protein